MTEATTGELQKVVLISDASADALRSQLAGLDLARRALSLPVAEDPPAELPNFVELWGETSRLRAVVAKSYSVPVWHYVQNLVTQALGHDSHVDGFVGMHFHRAEDLKARWQDHPQEAARGAADAARFMAVERSVSITAIETVWDGEIAST